MIKDKARNLVEKHSLIIRKHSKKILCSLRDGTPLDPLIKHDISDKKFNQIKKKYNEKLTFLKNNNVEIVPRNLPFLHILKETLPGFDWELNEPSTVANQNSDLVMKTYNVEGLTPSIASMLFNLVTSEHHSVVDFPELESGSEDIKIMISKLFEKMKFANGKAKISLPLINCFSRLKKEKKVDILTPLCPDYSNVHLGHGFYKLTFDGLGDKIGVTAKRLLENLEDLHRFFQDRDIYVQHTAAIGDFEALSEDTCKRVNLTRNQFIEKLHSSQNSLKKACGGRLKTILFTELCGGLENWAKIHGKYWEMLKDNNFGNSNINSKELGLICDARKPLLYKWFGKISDEQILEVVKWQGAEYAAMGEIAKNHYENPLVIGADHFKMQPFYQVSGDLPVLYLTSNYMRN